MILKNYPFPHKATKEQLTEIVDKIYGAIEATQQNMKISLWRMEQFTKLERQLLIERKLISSEFSHNIGQKATALDNSGKMALLINEEDHLNIRFSGDGLGLDRLIPDYFFYNEWAGKPIEKR